MKHAIWIPIVVLGVSPARSDTCPGRDVGTIPFDNPGDSFIINFDTCANNNTFEEDNPGSCGDGAYQKATGVSGPDDIFSFDIPVTGTYEWDTCSFPAGWDTSLMLREETGDGCPGELIACDGDSCDVGSFESSVIIQLVGGVTYYGIIDGWSPGDCGQVDSLLTLLETACANDGECDDGNACTEDVCEFPEGECVNLPNYDVATDCCNVATGFLTQIDDGNPCTQDVCDEFTGVVEYIILGEETPCNDQSDTVCDGADFCDGAGNCLTNVAPDGTACDDGNPSTTGDQCAQGVCVGQGVGNQTIHVPADAATIQSAIDQAEDGDEIVVAPGTYEETINLLGKAIELRSSDGAKQTVIDGGGAGSTVTCNSNEGPSTVIHGFTITGGDAGFGGGMYNENAAPVVSGCLFTGNDGFNGGGMYNLSSQPTIIGCAFIGNRAGSAGGGLRNTFSRTTIIGCSFAGNTATTGAGMDSHQSAPIIIDCLFYQNIASAAIGGLGVNSNAVIANCAFIENSGGGNGGGLYLGGGEPHVLGCLMSGNVAARGAGLYTINAGAPRIQGCALIANRAGDRGGAVHVRNRSDPTLTNCLVVANSSLNEGGVMYTDLSNPTMINCTVVANFAGPSGGLWLNTGSGQPTIINSIIWDNVGNLYNGPTEPVISYSMVEGGFPGVGNLEDDPWFVDLPGGDLRLMSGSACIDAASADALPLDSADLDADGDTDEPMPVDLGGNSRVVDDPDSVDVQSTLDMGAFEYQPATE